MASKLGVRSEDGILNLLSKYFPLRHKDILLGRGDDCALLKDVGPISVSTDLFIEDVHFRRSYFTAEEIGHKALACNISDLAACGSRPVGFTLAVSIPTDTEEPWLCEFFSGMASLASKHGMVLMGGDLSRSERIEVCITVFGAISKGGRFLSRGGVEPGDALFIVGQLGLARMGLIELEAQGRSAIDTWPKACAAHLKPEPQVDAGLVLSRVGGGYRTVTLMDVSDGIARDLPRLLGSTGEDGTAARRTGDRIGADVILPAGLLHPEFLRWCKATGRSPVREAILGGEDYALLGACPPALLPALHAAIPALWEIGTVTEADAVTCNGISLADFQGFDHFASSGEGA